MGDLSDFYRVPPWGLRWLFPTKTARSTASQILGLVRDRETDSTTPSDPETVGQAVIHTRQDLVLLVYWQEQQHRQLVTISRGVWIMGLLILMALAER
jgi:hypothetical protein